jgi:GxxExxY protein
MADPLTEAILAAAIEVHRELGAGLLESVYQEALCHEFSLRDIPFSRQVPVVLRYKGKELAGQRLDLLVDAQVVVELKSTRGMPESAVGQVLTYLRATGCRRGLVINFGEKKLMDGVRRVSL